MKNIRTNLYVSTFCQIKGLIPVIMNFINRLKSKSADECEFWFKNICMQKYL